jgi:hypothetical protein
MMVILSDTQIQRPLALVMNCIIHNNTIVDIDDPEGALGVEEGAETENIIYSNLLRNSTNGQGISLEQGSNAISDSDLEDEDEEDDNSSEND